MGARIEVEDGVFEVSDVYHRLRHLDTWSPVGVALQRKWLWRGTALEEVCHWWGLS